MLLQAFNLDQLSALLIPSLWFTRMKNILIQTVLENRLSRFSFINTCLEFNPRSQLCLNEIELEFD